MARVDHKYYMFRALHPQRRKEKGETMTKLAHLMRTHYKTDYDPDEPEYNGKFSASLPLNEDGQIVNVDWSEPGWVEVTWLISGRSTVDP